MQSKLVAYTDGSCSENPGGIGSWAYVLFEDGQVKSMRSGTEDSTTNNRMELMGIIMAMRDTGCEHIYTDSLLSVNCLSGKWRAKKNIDLIEEALHLIARNKVELSWVKGHSGVEGNELADKLCETAMQNRYFEKHGRRFIPRYYRRK